MEIRINGSGISELTDRLNNINRTALPYAVRYTLNDLALETKKNIPETSARMFKIRSKTFMRSHTIALRATGVNISSMESKVGIDASKKVSEALSKQEVGGTIRGRNFIPLQSARIRKNDLRAVAAVNKHRKVDLNSSGTKFFMIRSKGKRLMMKKAGKKKIIPIYTYKKNRSVNVKESGFMKKTAFQMLPLANDMFKRNANKQLQRFLR